MEKRVRKSEMPKEVIALGLRIAELIKEKEKKTRDVAHDANLDVENLRKYIKGSQEMKISVMIRIAKALDVDISALFKEDQERKTFHFSYDKKSTELDSSKIRSQLIFSILNKDSDAVIDSPNESTMLIESNKDYKIWESLFNDDWRDKLQYVLSEVEQKKQSHLIDSEFDKELSQNFKKLVQSIKDEKNRNNELSNY